MLVYRSVCSFDVVCCGSLMRTNFLHPGAKTNQYPLKIDCCFEMNFPFWNLSPFLGDIHSSSGGYEVLTFPTGWYLKFCMISSLDVASTRVPKLDKWQPGCVESAQLGAKRVPQPRIHSRHFTKKWRKKSCQVPSCNVDLSWSFHLTNNHVVSWSQEKLHRFSCSNYVSCVSDIFPAFFTWKTQTCFEKEPRYLNSLQVTGRLVTTGGADGRGSRLVICCTLYPARLT